MLPRVLRAWYILAESRELEDKPLARRLFDTPVVLFRGDGGRAGALLDRCPHRNVPLSLGSCVRGKLECPYHGWQFEPGGACTHVPSLSGPSEAKGRRAPALPIVERQGFVWAWGAFDEEPTSEPHSFAKMGTAGYTTVTRSVEARGSLFSTIENALDVPHTAFVHRGLFRTENRGISIAAKIRRTRDRVEVDYVGEPRPPGIVGKILSPSGGIVTHTDRFILPSIAQVEYRIGDENHILVDSVMTPIEDFVTRIYAVVSFKTRLPGNLLKPVLEPLALRIFAQDADMLARQTANIHHFGGEQFLSTEIDVMARHIQRLLRAAERGEVVSEESSEVTLLV